MWIDPNTQQTFKLHSEIRGAFKNRSFPPELTEEIISSVGLLPVASTPKPSGDHVKNITEGPPVLQGGVWTQVWNVNDATEEEIFERTKEKKISVRTKRNSLLTDSDWTQVSDTPVDSARWATYRQALRDITDHANFPWLNDEDWPAQPE